MKAVVFEDYGGPSMLADVPDPDLLPGQILIQMAYAGINPRDLNLRAGMFQHIPPPLGATSKIVGNEGAGTIVASAEETPTYPIGTPVFFREAYHLPKGGPGRSMPWRLHGMCCRSSPSRTSARWQGCGRAINRP